MRFSTKYEECNRVGGFYFLMLFSLPFIGVGIWTCFVIVNALFNFVDMQSWIKTEAKLTHVEQTVSHGKDSTTYGVKAEYEYSFDRKKYHGSRIGLHGGSDNVSDYQQQKYNFLSQRFKKNAPVACFVNPKAPEKAVLFVELRWEIIAFFMLFMFAFGGAGTALMTIAWRGRKKRVNFFSSTVKYSNKNTMIALILIASFANIMSFPMLLIALWEIFMKSNYIAAIALFFPLGAFLIAVLAVRSIISWRRFGVTILNMKSAPGIGGTLEGSIDTEVSIVPEGGFTLNLSCIHKNTGKNADEDLMWHSKKKVTNNVLCKDGTCSSIPVHFAIPSEGVSPTYDMLYERVFWRLDVEAGLPGVDYKASFEVNVINAPDGLLEYQLSEEEVAEAEKDFHESLAMLGIRIEQITKTEKAFVFPAFRNLSSFIISCSLSAIFGLIAVVMFLGAKDVLMSIPFAIFALLLFAVFAITVLFRSRITFTSRTLFLESGRFFITRREFDMNEIESIANEEGMRYGTTWFNNIFLYLSSGKKIKLGGMIPDRIIAERLADEMNKLIKNKLTEGKWRQEKR